MASWTNRPTMLPGWYWVRRWVSTDRGGFNDSPVPAWWPGPCDDRDLWWPVPLKPPSGTNTVVGECCLGFEPRVGDKVELWTEEEFGWVLTLGHTEDLEREVDDATAARHLARLDEAAARARAARARIQRP